MFIFFLLIELSLREVMDNLVSGIQEDRPRRDSHSSVQVKCPLQDVFIRCAVLHPGIYTILNKC